ncbi:hypothetical protein BKA67DRAFT_655193 [Truncatella angustata]|uniref:Uncharacterized protein n=1 Tax=Truncatella angustata TaxID=152316 RepID=A0A9P8URF8_9PEZI|nr:uncharacterized protein BKA67DRAFT_655193 [Truncatella angustata]KAH6656888.1 hypothetical protein BKA67DRAFT_655193 [Truncatella angustata]
MSQHGGGFYGYHPSGNMSSPMTAGNYQRPYGQPAADVFTPEMRDRQARGKDPYQDLGDSSDANNWAGRRRTKEEPFSIVEQRRQAAEILDNPELLLTNAQRDNEVS